MGVTKKDYEEISKSKSVARTLAIVKALAPLLRPLARLGFIKRRLDGTLGGRVGAISRCTTRGQHDKAADLAIKALKDYRHQPAGAWSLGGSDFWWMFMRLAAQSLEECGDQESWDQVIELAKNGVEPFQGYDAASSFLAFSRWKYKLGDYDAAVEFAKTAARADQTWAEPEFVLGWYCLVLGGGDAMTHLAEAVRKDQRFFFRIANDPQCRRYPHIIQRLKELSLDGIVTVGNVP